MYRTASRAKTAVAAVGLLALVACSDEPATPPVASSTPTAAAVITATPTPSPERRLLAIGEGADYGDYRTTVKEQKTTNNGMLIQAVLVQSCNQGAEPVKFTSARWELRDEDGGRYQAQWITGDPDFEPPYEGPNGSADVDPGDCMQGWIPFMTDRGVELRYSPRDLAQTVWTLR